MPRKRQYPPLRVLLNNSPVGHLLKEPSGAIGFRYVDSWLASHDALPVSHSLPLREDAYRGEPVAAVFENLLPDSDRLRRRVAERVGAAGIDAFSLLSQIGRDCVGALQFIPEGVGDDTHLPAADTAAIHGAPISDAEIETLLTHLAQAPLGLDQNNAFRISVAGAQEKTALLYHQGQWMKPLGTTPTTHILKLQIGSLPNGVDLSHSVENEYYCLKLFAAFGMPVNEATMQTFGKTRALVVQRFDRRWTSDGRLLRLPQEDCCQALSIPPTRKYQNEGGPGIADILRLLQAGDTPAEDQKTFLKAQILFWLIGATDGHAKNFSIFLGRGGRFRMTPLYDILTAQPSLDAHHLTRQQMKLAMSVGDGRHYRLDTIRGRHFVQSARRAGIAEAIATTALQEIAQSSAQAIAAVEQALPPGFPEHIHQSVKNGLQQRLAFID